MSTIVHLPMISLSPIFQMFALQSSSTVITQPIVPMSPNIFYTWITYPSTQSEWKCVLCKIIPIRKIFSHHFFQNHLWVTSNPAIIHLWLACTYWANLSVNQTWTVSFFSNRLYGFSCISAGVRWRNCNATVVVSWTSGLPANIAYICSLD